MFALFAVAILAFMIGFAHDNNAAVSIADSPSLNTLSTQISGNITNFNSQSQNTYTSIVNSSISSGGQTTTSGTPFAITPAGIFGITTNILTVGFNTITGGSPEFGIFLTTFLGIIVFVTAFLIWKTWAGRSPD